MDYKKATTEAEKNKKYLTANAEKGKENDANKYFESMDKIVSTLQGLGDEASVKYAADLSAYLAETRKKLYSVVAQDVIKGILTQKKWVDGAIQKNDMKNATAYSAKLEDALEKNKVQLERDEEGQKFLADTTTYLQTEVAAFLGKAGDAPKPAAAAPKEEKPAKEEKVKPVKEEKVKPVKEEKVKPVKEEKVKPAKPEKAAATSAPVEAGEVVKKLRRVDNNGKFPEYDDKHKECPAGVMAVAKKINAWTKSFNRDAGKLEQFMATLEADVAEALSRSEMAMNQYQNKVDTILSGLLEKTEDKLVPLQDTLREADPEDWAASEYTQTVTDALVWLRAHEETFNKVFEKAQKGVQSEKEVSAARAKVETGLELLKDFNSNSTSPDGYIQSRSYYNKNPSDVYRILEESIQTVEELDTAAKDEMAKIRKEADGLQAKLITMWALSAADSSNFTLARKYSGELATHVEHTHVAADVAKLNGQIDAKEEQYKIKEEERILGTKYPARYYVEGDEAAAKKIEEAALKFLREHPSWGNNPHRVDWPIDAITTGGSWSVIARDKDKNPIQWQILVHVLVYRCGRQGWGSDSFRLFHLGFFATECSPSAPVKTPPFVHIGVLGSSEFHEKRLSDEQIGFIKARQAVVLEIEAEQKKAEEAAKLKAIADYEKQQAEHRAKIAPLRKEWLEKFSGGVVKAGDHVWKYTLPANPSDNTTTATFVCEEGPYKGHKFDWDGNRLGSDFNATNMFCKVRWDGASLTFNHGPENPIGADESEEGYYMKRREGKEADGGEAGFSYYEGKGVYLPTSIVRWAFKDNTLTTTGALADEVHSAQKWVVEGQVPPVLVVVAAMYPHTMHSAHKFDVAINQKREEETRIRRQEETTKIMTEYAKQGKALTDSNLRHELMRRGL